MSKIDNNVKNVTGVKKFTQSITGILNVSIYALFGYLVAKLYYIIGLVDGIDTLYYKEDNWVFWLLLFITRAAYFAGCIAICNLIESKLQQLGYFWFKPSYILDKDEIRDKSGLILMILVVALFSAFLGEVFISVFNWIPPIYLP
jgi:hypothetical protein